MQGGTPTGFKFFLGAMLLLAVLTNQIVRKYAEQSRR
jgi:simple sugar transport system permease protein